MCSCLCASHKCFPNINNFSHTRHSKTRIELILSGENSTSLPFNALPLVLLHLFGRPCPFIKKPLSKSYFYPTLLMDMEDHLNKQCLIQKRDWHLNAKSRTDYQALSCFFFFFFFFSKFWFF